MLELLLKYARDRNLVAEPGFTAKHVRWAICCDEQGSFLSVVELGDVGQKGNRGQQFTRCPDLSHSELVRGSETKCHFLVETAEVVALYGRSGDTTREKHAYFMKLLEQAAAAMPELGSLARCLAQQTVLEAIRKDFKKHRAKPEDKVTCRLGDRFPVESEAWHDWWRRFRADLRGGTPVSRRKRKPAATEMRCLATGDLVTPLPTHPKIRGLADVGGRPSGDALICFDKEAFQSYGLSQSANAAVSEGAASTYREVLDTLLRENSQRLIQAKVAYWFKKKVPPENDPLPWLMEPPEHEEATALERARELLNSIRSGQHPDLMDNHYYVLTLSGAAGRVMVRDWTEGRFETLVRNVADWFDDLSIVPRDGGAPVSNFKFLAVLASTVRELKDAPAPYVTQMWQAAVENRRIPQVALARAVACFRVSVIQGDPASHAGVGLLKAYHVRNERTRRKEEGGPMGPSDNDLMPYLNEAHLHPAYQCGRLMAVLAALQRSALGDVGAGVVQRYYAAASSTPALVLGRLVRTGQFHLGKLKGGLAHWYESKLASISSRLKDNVPRTLDLEGQSLFALGYYQQLADLRTRKSAEPEQKREESHE